MAAFLTAPGGALADDPGGGNAGIDQYVEQVPAASGGESVASARKPSKGGAGVSTSTRRDLGRSGSAGQLALDLASSGKSATGRDVARGRHSPEQADVGRRGQGAAGGIGSAVVGGGGSPGLGLLLPVLLLAATLAAALIAARLRTRNRQSRT
jgi:hypothetical protein